MPPPTEIPRAQPATGHDSMTGQLIRFQAASLLITGVLVAVLTFWLTWQALNESRNHTLEQVAYSVVRHGIESEDANAPDPTDAGQFVSQIWTGDGRLHYSSTDDDGPPRQPPGWHRLTWEGVSWQVFTLIEDDLTIQVSQADDTRTQAFWRTVPMVIGMLCVVTFLLYLLLNAAARRSLQPLGRLKAALGVPHHPAQLPDLSHQPWPRELAPLVDTLQDLFAQLTQSRAAHAHLVTRAAHEFRTPLAALKIHTQLLARQPDEAQRAQHQVHLLQAVDRLTRLVNQLLKLAELEEPDHAEPTQPLDTRGWLDNALTLWGPLAQAHGVTLTTRLPDGLVLTAKPHTLHAAVDNLVHNAIRHSASGSVIDISVQTADDSTQILAVRDHGSGMTASQRDNRGSPSRADPNHTAHSERSGLGLAIVRRVMALHQGALALDDTPGGGLTAILTWPAPPSAACETAGSPTDTRQ
jgi:signal transduction histidine kinase